MKRIRVLVADDSITVRKRIVETLASLPDFEVVGEAADGREAIEACQRLRPDVVTLDIMMPVMTGLAATEYIMAYCPTPILIVSSSFNRGELVKTYDALAAGALDSMEKQPEHESDETWERRLASTLRIVSRIKVITHPRGRLAHLKRSQPSESLRNGEVHASHRPPCELIAIGASTGGPGAIVSILNQLPSDFRLPILLVIHLSHAFGGGFADWLNGLSRFPVAFARDDEPLPEPGACRVVLAPPDRHLIVRDRRLRLTNGAERHSCRPSVDTLFETVAADLGGRAAACLLTGMGRDGAEGLRAIRNAGGATFAQDEKSCVVFGMPNEAIRIGAAEQVLPLDQFGAHLAALASRTHSLQP